MKRILITVILLIILIFIVLIQRNIIRAEGVAGNDVEFLGGYVKATNPNTVSPNTFSFEAFIEPTNIAGKQIILSIGDKATSSLHYEIGLDGSTLYWTYRYGQNSQTTITAGDIPAGVWSHIALVVSSQSTRIYINGAALPVILSGAHPLPAVGGNIVLGNSYSEPFLGANVFRGEIDELRISNVERDVPSLWASGAYTNGLNADNGAVILWHFDQNRGETTVNDSSGNSINGALIGGDSLIHFFGVLPTPTQVQFNLSPIIWNRPILPTLSMPSIPTIGNRPSNGIVVPTIGNPLPTGSTIRDIPRPTRAFRI